MSAQPQVVPMMMEIDDLDADDEFEAREAESDDKAGGLLGLVKSPMGMAAIGVVVIGLGAAAFLFGSGTIAGFGTPQLNNQSPNAEESIALSQAAEALEQVDLNVQGEEVMAGGDERISGDSAHGGAERRTMPEEEAEPTGYGEISYTDSGAIYHTAPTTVTLQIGETQRDLTLSLGILADRPSAQLLKTEGLTVNLLTIEAAQSVDFGPFLDWQIPGLITKDLRDRIEARFPDADIRAIMIRDFQF